MNIPNRITWLKSEIDRLNVKLSNCYGLSERMIQNCEDKLYDYTCELVELETLESRVYPS